MNSTLKNQIKKSLVLALLDFKDEKECLEFLEDFLTENELETLSKRLAVAYWLSKSRNYKNIQENLKVSSATVAEISSMSQKKGFKNAIKKIEADEWADKWTKKIKKIIN